ncbi:TAXI family TRAP transporter solute-binding subunit [Pseudooceanicola sp.]|uniref:TAXI family TRAP transporter solute-binding subunit n=1 Tax=Pseudooceanicola sp. TaxID=1914328 RepID=UPI002607DD6D|nr:TAXI family TRAP transporter solute-binding subunit [Pseudooceanicola sp.]MDF1854419.1 TAXI family TRAP transporter solute-binding subunit [Pseudooceanicola sp.]
MKFKVQNRAITGLALVAMLLATPLAAQDDFKWPRLLVIGTPGTSTGSFASTNGWAPVMQQETGMTVRVVPNGAEPERYKRLVDRRDIQISSVSASEMRFQIQGIGGYAAVPAKSMRMIWHHNDTPWGFVTSGKSGVTALEDLKKGGLKFAQAASSPAMTDAVKVGMPAYLGMTQEEVDSKITYVPTSSYGENCKSVVEGKADIAYCSPISSVLSEMEAAPGSIRWLPMPADNPGWAAYLSFNPMLVPATFTVGVSSAKGVPGATSNFVYTVPTDADEDFVYHMAKWFDTSFATYSKTHMLAARMSRELWRGYLDRTPMPVHAGTVRYLREIGVWTDADDKWNGEAIATMDAWIAARDAALKDARNQKVEINFENPEYLAILEKHTKGLTEFRSRL